MSKTTIIMEKFDGLEVFSDDLFIDTPEGDEAWLGVRFEIKQMLGLEALPDLQGILFSIGLQELGQIKDEFTKEERQDLMHIAVCRLLSYDGYYQLEGYDADDWPHWRQVAVPPKGRIAQELLLRKKIIQYIDNIKNS